MSHEVGEGVGAVALSEDVVTASNCDIDRFVLDSRRRASAQKCL